MPRGVTVTVRRSPRRDRHGDVVPGSQPPDDTIEGCKVAPRSATEDDSGLRSSTFTGLTVVTPPGVGVSAADQLLIPGYAGVWEVDGMPGRWDLSGTTGRGGVVIPVKQVAG